MAAISGVASAADPDVVRTIDIDTSAHSRVDEAKIRIFEDGAMEHVLAGHQPHDASAVAFSIEMTNPTDPKRSDAKLVQVPTSETPGPSEDDLSSRAASGGTQDDIGTMGHSGGNSDSDGDAYLKMICEKGDRCGCWPEYEVYDWQSAEWNDDDGDGCVSDPENYWESGWAINGSSCNSWNHENYEQWEDDGPCSLDQVREDRFSYGGGSNEIVMRQQLTLHADGSNDWEVLRYDDGGNGCLFHGVEAQ